MSTLWIKYNISTTVYTFINHTVISSCFYPFISTFAFIISWACWLSFAHYFVSIAHSMHSKNRPCKQAIFHHYIISMVFSYIVFVFLSHLSFPGILYSIKKIGGIYHEWFISNTVRLWKKWNVWFWWRQQLLLHHHPSSSLLLLRKWFWKWLWLWRRK